MHTEPLTERTLIITRTFNAPRALVFEAWTKPEHMVRWFGPTDFTLPHCEMEFRVGGAYTLCMRAPDGTEYWVRGAYREITPPERLVFTWKRNDLQGNPWVDNIVTLTFEEREGKTLFTLHQALFAAKQDCDDHRGGWTKCIDRLAAFVERQ